MKISAYLKEDFCIMDLKAKGKEDVVKEIIENLNSSGKIRNKEQFIADVLERESLGSTGIGYGVAIPHARTEAVDSFVIGFGNSKDGIDFNSLDGQKVNIIFLMGAGPKELNRYLRLLAELSKLLMDEAFRKELLLASSAGQILEVIKKFERT